MSFRLAAVLPLIAGGMALILATSAQAENIDCANASNTVEMNFCADKDYQAADKDLNHAFDTALAYVKSRELEKPYDAKSFEDAPSKRAARLDRLPGR